MKNEERIETLARLGLTLTQARAYLALVQAGSAGAKELSDASKITRQDIYRVMPTLEKTGIVEKLITKPTAYRAVPIKQAAAVLLKRKIEEQKELRRKTKELVRDIENNHAGREIQQEPAHFIMVSGKDAIIQKMGEKLQKVQTSIDVVTTGSRFSSAIIEFAKGYEKALERGVRIRIATEKHVIAKTAFEIVQTLMKNPGFEVKYFIEAPQAIIAIFDKKEASVTISEVANLERASALWSNDSSFIGLANNYFENKWNNSTAYEEQALP